MSKRISLAEAAREVMRLSRGPIAEDHGEECAFYIFKESRHAVADCVCGVFTDFENDFFKYAVHLAERVAAGDEDMLSIMERHGYLKYERTWNSSRLVGQSRYRDMPT